VPAAPSISAAVGDAIQQARGGALLGSPQERLEAQEHHVEPGRGRASRAAGGVALCAFGVAHLRAAVLAELFMTTRSPGRSVGARRFVVARKARAVDSVPAQGSRRSSSRVMSGFSGPIERNDFSEVDLARVPVPRPTPSITQVEHGGSPILEAASTRILVTTAPPK
jgi:hypothetical protein